MEDLAREWDEEHPELPVSVFACRFPGKYREAATALRKVRGVENDMALSIEQKLELKTAEHNNTVRELLKTTELLDYYRSRCKHDMPRSRPPAGYWVKGANQRYVWGLLSDGDLIPKGKTDVYEEAVEECWAHYDKIHKVRHLNTPPPSREHIDLDDLTEDDEPPAPITRRRRRVIND